MCKVAKDMNPDTMIAVDFYLNLPGYSPNEMYGVPVPFIKTIPRRKDLVMAVHRTINQSSHQYPMRRVCSFLV
jgi:hypothetical protein